MNTLMRLYARIWGATAPAKTAPNPLTMPRRTALTLRNPSRRKLTGSSVWGGRSRRRLLRGQPRRSAEIDRRKPSEPTIPSAAMFASLLPHVLAARYPARLFAMNGTQWLSVGSNILVILRPTISAS